MLNHPGRKCTWSKIVISLMSVLFSINLKRTSKGSTNRCADMGSLWRAPFSKLKYGVVYSPFVTHDCWLIFLSSILNFYQNRVSLKH